MRNSTVSNIPQSRLILYLIIAGILPIFIVAANFITSSNALDRLKSDLSHVQSLALARKKKQSTNIVVREHFHDADHFYIDKHLETLSFLKPEVEALQKIVNNKYYAGDENVKRRLEFITGQSNSLLFSEGSVLSYPFFQETTATLIHPVEVNLDDLKETLALVEGLEIGPYKPGPNRPQLIILDFKLDKREATDKNDVFLLNMKLLKREYSS